MVCYSCNSQRGYLPSGTETYMKIPFYSNQGIYENKQLPYFKEIGTPGNDNP